MRKKHLVFFNMIMMRTNFISLKTRVLNILKKNFNDVSVHLNANRKVHKGEVNKIAECNLLHDIINTPE